MDVNHRIDPDAASDSPAPTAAGPSPLEAGLDLPLSAEASYLGRRAVADILAGWRIRHQELTDDLLLITSELVTNAVRHGGERVRLELTRDDDSIRVSVSDGSSVLPHPRDPEDDGEVGRGLYILTALAEAWGVENSSHGGKEVWAKLRLPAHLAD